MIDSWPRTRASQLLFPENWPTTSSIHYPSCAFHVQHCVAISATAELLLMHVINRPIMQNEDGQLSRCRVTPLVIASACTAPPTSIFAATYTSGLWRHRWRHCVLPVERRAGAVDAELQLAVKTLPGATAQPIRILTRKWRPFTTSCNSANRWLLIMNIKNRQLHSAALGRYVSTCSHHAACNCLLRHSVTFSIFHHPSFHHSHCNLRTYLLCKSFAPSVTACIGWLSKV